MEKRTRINTVIKYDWIEPMSARTLKYLDFKRPCDELYVEALRLMGNHEKSWVSGVKLFSLLLRIIYLQLTNSYQNLPKSFTPKKRSNGRRVPAKI